YAGAIEAARDLFGLRRRAITLRRQRRQQIPVHVVTVRDRGLRLKDKRSAQQAVAHDRRQKLVRARRHVLVPTGARKEQNAETTRLLVGRWKGRELPRLRQRLAPAAHKRQGVRPAGL